MKAVTIIAARWIAGCGNGDALVLRHAGPGKLSDDPAVSELVIHYYGVSAARIFARATKAPPKGRNAVRTLDGGTVGLIKYLVTLIDHLHVMVLSNFAIRVRGAAIAVNARVRNAIK